MTQVLLQELSANINSIKLSQNSDQKHIDTEVFTAYDMMKIDVTSEYDSNIASLHYYLKASNGSLRILDNSIFKIDNTPPGNYLIVAQIKGNSTRLVLASMEKAFVIESKFMIDDLKITNSPEFIKVNRGENVEVNLSYRNLSNITKDIREALPESMFEKEILYLIDKGVTDFVEIDNNLWKAIR